MLPLNSGRCMSQIDFDFIGASRDQRRRVKLGVTYAAPENSNRQVLSKPIRINVNKLHHPVAIGTVCRDVKLGMQRAGECYWRFEGIRRVDENILAILDGTLVDGAPG